MFKKQSHFSKNNQKKTVIRGVQRNNLERWISQKTLRLEYGRKNNQQTNKHTQKTVVAITQCNQQPLTWLLNQRCTEVKLISHFSLEGIRAIQGSQYVWHNLTELLLPWWNRWDFVHRKCSNQKVSKNRHLSHFYSSRISSCFFHWFFFFSN